MELIKNKTFAQVSKLMRTLFPMTTTKGLALYQMDVTNTFIHGDIQEEVCMSLPPDFRLAREEYPKNLVCSFQKCLYYLKQSPKNWFHKFPQLSKMRSLLSQQHIIPYSTRKIKTGFIAILVHVDDIISARTNEEENESVKKFLHSRIHIKGLGRPN